MPSPHSVRAAVRLGTFLFVLAMSGFAGGNEKVRRIERVENGLRPYSWAFFGDESRHSILERMKAYGVPGVSLAVIVNGRLAWAKAYGVKNVLSDDAVATDTLFQAASISKPLNAAAVLQRVERGVWSLDQDIGLYLRSWRVPPNPFTAQSPLTISRLLNHTGGVSNFNDRTGYMGYRTTDPLPTLVQMLNGAPPSLTGPVTVEAQPGQSFRYSNGGTTILQLMLTDLEGRPYEAILEDDVLAPLGMKDSLFAQPLPASRAGKAATAHDQGLPLEGGGRIFPELAAAGLWTTPSDLAKFLIEIWMSLQGRSNRILSRPMAERMVSPYPPGGGYAEGFQVTPKGKEIYFGHRGGNYGFYSDMIIHRRTGCGAIVMVNGGGDALNSNLRREILIAIAEEYGWPEYLPPRLAVVALNRTVAARFMGRFLAGEDDAVRIDRLGERFFANRAAERDEILPIARDEMAARAILPRRYKLVMGADASGDILRLTSGGETVDAPRLAEDVVTPAECLAAGRVERALDLYRDIYRKNPSSPAVRESRINGLGYVYLRKNETATALALFRLNADWHPQSANAFDSLGEACFKDGDLERAEACYKKALELNPVSANARAMLQRIADRR